MTTCHLYMIAFWLLNCIAVPFMVTSIYLRITGR